MHRLVQCEFDTSQTFNSCHYLKRQIVTLYASIPCDCFHATRQTAYQYIVNCTLLFESLFRILLAASLQILPVRTLW